MRSGGPLVGAGSYRSEPTIGRRRIAWVRKAIAIAEPYAPTGRYVGEVSDTGADVVQSVYGAGKMDRLVSLKRTWDSDNVFRMNQNIKP